MTEAIKEAKKRIKKKKDFYTELGSYVGISIFLVAINIFVSPGYMWAWWPVGMWGLSLVMKGIKIMVEDKTSKWEKKALKESLNEMGYDPELAYMDDHLDLEEEQLILRKEKLYRDDDLV